MALCAVAFVFGSATCLARVPDDGVETDPTHFIILIDDSGGMKHYRDALIKLLPDVLFGRLRPPSSIDHEPPPVVDKNHDMVSVGFYGLKRNRLPCDGPARNPLSLLPSNLFAWISPPGLQPMTEDDFSKRLTDALPIANQCRLDEEFSPVGMAPVLAIASLGQQFQEESFHQRFARIVIVNVSDFSMNTDPAKEIFYFSRGVPLQNGTFKVADGPEALRLSQRVLGRFSVTSVPGWMMTAGKDTVSWGYGDLHDSLRMDYSEAQPILPNPDLLVDAPRAVTLDREAKGGGRLAIVSTDGPLPQVNIRAGECFIPDLLSSEISGQSQSVGLAWPDRHCVGAETPVGWDLLKLKGLSEEHTVADQPRPEQLASTVRLRVRFHYDGDLYQNLYRWSAWHVVDFSTVPVRTVPQENLLVNGDSWLLGPLERRLFPAVRLDDAALSALAEETGTRPLNQKAAEDGIHRKYELVRGWYIWIGLPLFVILCGLAMIVAWINYTRRRFSPRVAWHPIKGVSLNFDGLGDAPILLGTFEVINEAPRKRLTQKEEPHREGNFTLVGWDVAAAGFRVDPSAQAIGFVAADGSGALAPGVMQTIVDGATISLFLDPRVIADFAPSDDTIDATSVPVAGILAMSWPRRRWRAARLEPLPVVVGISLRPESGREPFVRFDSAGAEVEFQGHGPDEPPHRRPIGRFHFESRASRRFARPFAATFALRGDGPEGPVRDGGFMVDQPEVVVPAQATIERQAIVVCDGETIRNPSATADIYRVMLVGRHAPGSQAGPHLFAVLRDSTQCEPTLFIDTGTGAVSEIAWDRRTGQPMRRLKVADSIDPPFAAIEGGRVVLPLADVRFDKDSAPYGLFRLTIGNSGKVGKGEVQASMAGSLAGDELVLDAIEYDNPGHQNKLVMPFDVSHQAARTAVRIAEGQPAEELLVQLSTSLINRLTGSVIEAGLVNAELSLEIITRTDGGDTRTRKLSIMVPLRLEQLPSPNWLCIDFGTSAIAVAYGHETNVYILPLQDVRQSGEQDEAQGPSLADFDRGNIERGGNLLPSFVICDADRRRTEDNGDRQLRPGFPGYRPARLNPGEASFIGLPATSPQLHDSPGRVIYSLKSWIGQSASEILLGEEITIIEDGRERKTKYVPLQKVVQSGLAALAEAYISAAQIAPGRVILTHPNTFTPLHKDRLHSIGLSVFSKQFGISRPERVTLMSESDAVAYFYCQKQREAGHVPAGIEHIMVYDLGAGTLDLSIIRVEWASGLVRFPDRWQTLYRLGVPVAGNYLDAAIARLIDQTLLDPKLVDPDLLDYRYPLTVCPSAADEADHAAASRTLWLAIRAAKQGLDNAPVWDGEKPMHITVAAPGTPDRWPVMAKASIAGAGSLQERYAELAGPPDRAALVFRKRSDGDRLELVLPADQVHRYADIAEFITFVAGDVIDEALLGAGVEARNINTVLVSGRGALWPGLRQRITGRFPAAKDGAELFAGLPSLMKESVVRGAISWQGMPIEPEPPLPARLAVVLIPSNVYVPDEKWKDGLIPLGDNTRFRVVQVAHQSPDPLRDMQSARRFFYIDVGSPYYRIDANWGKDRRLHISKETSAGGQTIIYIGNSKKRDIYTLSAQTVASVHEGRPPWPIGKSFLDPDRRA